MIKSKILNTKGNAEINGLYIQFYLSNLCENICKIYEFGTFEKDNSIYVYAVLEKLADLQEFYANNLKQFQNNNITNNDIFYKKILKDALTGLSCMHENNYYHFDIKIENIGYIQESNIGKLIDFGSARYLNDECVMDPNFIPSFYYTDPYILQKNELCKYNDLYSFAMVLLTIESFLSVKLIFKTIINDLIKPLTYDNLTTIFNTFWNVQKINPNPLTKQQLYDKIFKESYEKIKYYTAYKEKDINDHLSSINDYYKKNMMKRISAKDALIKYSKLFDISQQGGKKKSIRKKTKKSIRKKTKKRYYL
jgi:serine/threonine protein kinase